MTLIVENGIKMTEISYKDFGLPVREDITAVHRRAWKRLSEAGTWLTGAERVAIAQEARAASDCNLCQTRKDALSPNSINGNHDHMGRLLDNEVENFK